MDEFNFDLFENICEQLEEISIEVRNLDDKFLAKLFYGHNFPYLHKLVLRKCQITKFEKKFFDRDFQFLKYCHVNFLGDIDVNMFSDLKFLKTLYLNNIIVLEGIIVADFKKLFIN